MDVITPMLPMMGTMEFVCGICIGAFMATCLMTTAHIIDLERNKEKR